MPTTQRRVIPAPVATAGSLKADPELVRVRPAAVLRERPLV